MLTNDMMSAIDDISSAFINTMDPGPRKKVIASDRFSMVFKKDLTKHGLRDFEVTDRHENQSSTVVNLPDMSSHIQDKFMGIHVTYQRNYLLLSFLYI